MRYALTLLALFVAVPASAQEDSVSQLVVYGITTHEMAHWYGAELEDGFQPELDVVIHAAAKEWVKPCPSHVVVELDGGSVEAPVLGFEILSDGTAALHLRAARPAAVAARLGDEFEVPLAVEIAGELRTFPVDALVRTAVLDTGFQCLCSHL